MYWLVAWSPYNEYFVCGYGNKDNWILDSGNFGKKVKQMPSPESEGLISKWMIIIFLK